jgi:hypothetical protein
MLVTVPDSGLGELLASRVLMERLWQGTTEEVQTLVQVLRIAEPSLQDVLDVGLVRLTTTAGKPSGSSGLSYERAVVTGVARRGDGRRVPDAARRAREVTWLEVRDVAAGGRSALGRAG